jgi:hypothetical protein
MLTGLRKSASREGHSTREMNQEDKSLSKSLTPGAQGLDQAKGALNLLRCRLTKHYSVSLSLARARRPIRTDTKNIPLGSVTRPEPVARSREVVSASPTTGSHPGCDATQQGSPCPRYMNNSRPAWQPHPACGQNLSM